MSSRKLERKIFEHNFYFHSDLGTKFGSKTILDFFVDEEIERVCRAREKLQAIEIIDEELSCIVEEVRQDLIELYLGVGITIKPSDFPPIYLIPVVRNNFVVNTFGGEALASVVCVDERMSLLNLAGSIYHELHHSIGRKALVRNTRLFFCAQIGYFTYALRGKKSVKRGEFLEEGVIAYFEHLFTTRSPRLFKVRQKHATFYKIGANFPKSSPAYEKVRKMIETLVDKAVEADGEDGGKKMKRLLLRSRMLSGERALLRDYIDSLFGKGMTSKIFWAPFFA